MGATPCKRDRRSPGELSASMLELRSRCRQVIGGSEPRGDLSIDVCGFFETHLEVPPTLWRPFVDERHREYAPTVVQLPTGGDAWQMPNGDVMAVGLNVAAGQARGARYFFAFAAGFTFDEAAAGAAVAGAAFGVSPPLDSSEGSVAGAGGGGGV